MSGTPMAAGAADPWGELAAELDRWAAAGRTATLWWRDDDASDLSPALDRLLDLAGEAGVPLALAVVPSLVTDRLAARLAGLPDTVAVLQHGYGHTNYGEAGEQKIELGPHRPAMVVAGELATGWLALEQRFPGRALPVMVPPWNRIAPALLPFLPELGYRGLSQFAPRKKRLPVRGLLQVNCHVDVIDWRGSRGFVGVEAALAVLAGHLALRRAGWASQPVLAEEPTGIMTHHARHDAALTGFLTTLFARTGGHPAVRWLPAAEAFAP